MAMGDNSPGGGDGVNGANSGGNTGDGPGEGDGGGGFFDGGSAPSNPGFAEELVKKKTPQELAAEAIQRGLDAATATTKAGVKTANARLDPYAKAGKRQLGAIENLLTPEGQKDFVQNNPFFTALADDAQRRIFNNSSARGKVGSGGTAEALQNSILLMGNDLVGEDIKRRSSIFETGANAAGRQAGIEGAGSINLAELEARGGETEGAGILGLENTRRQDRADRRSDATDLVKTVITAALSDRRMKTNITPLGSLGDVPVYLFKYKWSDTLEVGTMAQEVEHIPGAVFEIGGIKHVDYARL